jgi:hypothetical protein
MNARRAIALPLAAVICVVLAPPAHGQYGTFFEETFTSPLDPLKWRTEDLVAGKRWCDAVAGLGYGPGSWVAPGSEPCYGVTQPLPLGFASLDQGLLQLSGSGRAFPYLALRAPGPAAVVPAAGDFVMTVGMRFDQGGGFGTGFSAVDWPNTEPADGNAPAIHGAWA